MAGRSRQGVLFCVAVVTCVVTVTSVTWLSNLVAAQHAMATRRTSSGTGHGRHQLLASGGRVARVDVSQNQDLTRVGITAARKGGEQARRGERRWKRQGNTAENGVDTLPKEERDVQKTNKCHAVPNTDYWGDAVEWGTNNRKASAEECCQACAKYKPLDDSQPTCNVWVYCGDKQRCGTQYQECWLKHLIHAEAIKPKTGPHVPWTSGVFGLPPPVTYKELTADTGEDRSFHVVVTAQGAATHWQARVHYYWYKKVQKECRAKGVCHMGGWTRLLHSGQPDDLMDEIPTHVVQPLTDKDNKGYVVLNRPWAFVQWLREVTVPEKYILMSEPDHIWLKPMPNLMLGSAPAAFPFFYIEPAKADYVHITEKFTGKLTRRQIESISPIGNAPTLLRYSDLEKVAQTWMNTSHAIFDDKEAHEAWGWVLEMYGFTISCFKAGVEPATLYLDMMAQPPWDNDVPYGPSYYLLHYTYGMDYTKEGKFTPGKIGEWRFDKRVYGHKPPPRNLGAPPPGMDNTLVAHLIKAINEATAAIPGWDEYAKIGIATQHWDGKV